ncbi:hypothetical protein [Paenibacillus sp. Mc5Re-14]|uniref:hypothetical protein n=1 Tax=Paenibacillus sp. Mc5Re-14 TaxID=1030529 RepID=UPI000AFAAD4B|nr:hypothetical protein [Paenibacillus sp. Mc5Re-14]
MNIYEIQEYAKDHGFDSLKFAMTNRNGATFYGHFLDAYFGMIMIPEIGDGFIVISHLIQEYGFDEFEFTVLEGN